MKISVIIPVYNLGKYIEKSLNSILSQEFDQSLEIIVVDDGSTDNSSEVVDKISKADSRVKLFRQQNAGVSAARNAGLDLATGQYVLFVDGDDILFPGALQKLADELDNDKGAILACGLHNRITSYDQEAPTLKGSVIHTDSKEILQRLLAGEYDVSACAKMFVKSLIRDIRFIPGKKINEDKYFLFEYLLRNNGIVIDNDTYVYGYYIRSGSATTSRFSSGTLDMLFFSEAIENDVKQSVPEMFNYARYNNIVTHLAVLKKIVRSNEYKNQKACFKQLRKETLALQKANQKNTENKHILELSMLRAGVLPYIACVKLFDILKAGK